MSWNVTENIQGDHLGDNSWNLYQKCRYDRVVDTELISISEMMKKGKKNNFQSDIWIQ